MTKETKVYLNTIEDLTKALSDGKTVYYDCGDTYEEVMEIKLVNGIMVQKYEYKFYLNPSDLEFDKNEFYLKEKAQLKIEVGKSYKTRDKRKVVCVYKEKIDRNFSQPNKCVIIGEGSDFWVTEEGRFSKSECDCGLDIVDYWED